MMIVRYILVFFSIFLFFTKGYGQEITHKKDKGNNKVVFYLNIETKVVDSIVVDNVDFYYTWFEQLNANLYHFIYETTLNAKPNTILRKQILISVNESRLLVSLIMHKKIAKLPSRPLKINGGNGFFYTKEYDLYLDSAKSGKVFLNVSSKIIDEVESLSIDSTFQTFKFQLDSTNNIFYNKLDTLDGFYQYLIKDTKGNKGYKEVYFNNEVISTIQVKGFDLFYYNGKWFSLSGSGVDKVFSSYFEQNMSEINDLKERPDTRFYKR